MARQRRLWCCRRLPRPQAVRCPRQSRQDAPASETRVAARRRSVLKYRTHPNLTSTKSQDVPAESVEIWFRRMSAWAAGRDQCIYSGGRRLVERTGHRQGHCLERSKPLIETLFSQKLGPWVCTKVCAFRILRASETQCTCGFHWAEAKSHPFRQFLLYVCSVGDGEQFQPQFREGARRINGYRLRLHHAFVQRALAVYREIVGIGTDRHLHRHLGQVDQPYAGHGHADQIPHDVGNLVSMSVSGIRLIHLAQVPMEVPVRPDTHYFSIDSQSTLYEGVMKAQAISIYAPSTFTELRLELFAITD